MGGRLGQSKPHLLTTGSLVGSFVACVFVLSLPTESRVGAQAAVPPPTWAQSIEITSDGAPVVLQPAEGARRRGTVAVGTRLSLKRRVFGSGCPTDTWFETREGYFVCEAHAQPSNEPPGGTPVPHVPAGQQLPLTYGFVQTDGTPAYADLSDYLTGEYAKTLGEGFGVVIRDKRVYEGVEFVRVRGGYWIEAVSIGRAGGSKFGGFTLGPDEDLSFAWVNQAGATVHRVPKGKIVHTLGHREVLQVGDVRDGDWAQLTDGAWIRERYLVRPTRQPRPAEVAPKERWIDVDVATQVLVAYDGDKPVFATLVSTGRDRRDHRTPIGKFRLWVKLAFSDMNDTERTDLAKNYSIQNVPWVQYFEGSNGFHAAFWHNRFGQRRSHGCVNLTPRDARFLFDFTEPRLPDGWKAVLPTEGERATLIQVR